MVLFKDQVFFYVGAFLVSMFCLSRVISNHVVKTSTVVSNQKNPDVPAGYVKKTNRPLIHTFYAPLNRDKDTESERWRKTHEGEDNLLKEWRAAWYKAGFDPIVLSIEDAYLHPEFNEMKDEVNKVFGHEYDALCYYRWFAMAALENGGWMVDYDLFPLNFPSSFADKLPNDGQFTSFAAHVPAMIVGSKEEWNRVSKLLLENIPKSDVDYKSDMQVLWYIQRELDNNGIVFLPMDKYVRPTFDYRNPREIDCDELEYAMAVHLSHHSTYESYDKGTYPLIDSLSEREEAIMRRGEAGRTYLEDWNEQCKHRFVS